MSDEQLVLLIDLLDKLGYNTEAGGSGTVFQRLAQIAGYTDQVEGFVDTLESNLGTTGDAADAAGSVNAKLAELLTNRLTAARAAYLDAAISSCQKPRRAIKGAYTGVGGAWRTALSVSGKGTLKALQMTTVNLTCQVRVTIDGTVVSSGVVPTNASTNSYWPSPFMLFVNSGTLNSFADVAGGGNAKNCEISFNTSLLLEIYPDTNSMTLDWIYEAE